jgi:hypothetical protein
LCRAVGRLLPVLHLENRENLSSDRGCSLIAAFSVPINL